MKKLRLLITKECDKHCRGCCNKQWDLDKLPVCKSYKGYDEIMITGGEPLLDPLLVERVIENISSTNHKAKIILYTGNPFLLACFAVSIPEISLYGITLTLHNNLDAKIFRMFEDKIEIEGASLRLNVFKGVKIPTLYNPGNVKDNITWIKNCPLPKNEIFMRL